MEIFIRGPESPQEWIWRWLSSKKTWELIWFSRSREMVLYLRRPGGQSQFSAALTLQASDRNQIAEICTWAVDHLDEDLSVEKLAAKAGMSPRNFARVFLNETHTTPARFIERLRIEGARRRLEESRDKLEKVATDCGLDLQQACIVHFIELSVSLRRITATASPA